jgi:hypothetical protein
MQPGELEANTDLDWTAPRRRPPRASDEALTGTARRWLRELPVRRRPIRLCQIYPRVANRLAWCWSDTTLATHVLDDLLVDRRGGRRGFPRQVQCELERLRQFNQHKRVEQREEGLWRRLGRAWG